MYKAGFPYLVDISLSSVCPLAKKDNSLCSVASKCYASPVTKSTTKGDYGNFDDLCGFIDELYKSGTFELVFGGGSEPTTAKMFTRRDTDMRYPKTLAHIVQKASNQNFKMGVTTRNYNFHKHPDFETVLNHIDSLAISINSPMDVIAASHLIGAVQKYNDDCHEKYRNGPLWEQDTLNTPVELYSQTIVGIYAQDVFITILEGCAKLGIKNTTLLGYKDYGNGKGGAPFEYDNNWIKEVKAFSEKFETNIGADSILVQKHRQDFINEGVPAFYLVGREGESSCYYKADTNTMHTSSFGGAARKYQKGQLLNLFAEL